MDWHWLPFALIGAILWIIQNVRNQQQPPQSSGAVRRLPMEAPEPSRRSSPPDAMPRANRKGRSREPAPRPSRTPRADAARQPPRIPVQGPGPAAADTSRWTEPPVSVVNSIVSSEIAPSGGTPIVLSASALAAPSAGPSTARRAAILLKQPGSAAVALVLREILDEPLCKRGRRHRR